MKKEVWKSRFSIVRNLIPNILGIKFDSQYDEIVMITKRRIALYVNDKFYMIVFKENDSIDFVYDNFCNVIYEGEM